MKDLSYMPLIDYIDYNNNIYFCEAISSRAQCNNKHIDLGVMDLELNDRETDEHGDPTLIQSISHHHLGLWQNCLPLFTMPMS